MSSTVPLLTSSTQNWEIPELIEQQNSLGSKYIVFRADKNTIINLSNSDLNKSYPRTYLDSKNGLVMLMTPSSRHDRLCEKVNLFILLITSMRKMHITPLRSSTLRENVDHKTGIEPDNCYYIDPTKVKGYEEAERNTNDLYIDYMVDNPPDLVTEIGYTSIDETKGARYRELGVSELWQINVPSIKDNNIEITFKDLKKDNASPLSQSKHIPGITPEHLEYFLNIVREKTGTNVVEYIDVLKRTLSFEQDRNSPGLNE